MRQYLDLLRDIRANGVRKPTRAVLKSTGEHVDAISVFGRQIRFDLGEGFPLVTTKRVNFDAIVHELIWFLSGSTNIAYLQDNGVKIWDAWADENGELGPVYGVQWRGWTGGDGVLVDQIANLVRDVKTAAADTFASCGRRMLLTAWNPAEIADMALPPCHVLSQFMVAEGKLSCQLYQRSADLFLGVPYNVASYALLTHLIAHVTGLEVGEFVHTFGDAHVYTNHLDQVNEQLTRRPHRLPVLMIDQDLSDIDDVTFSDVDLLGYAPMPALRGEVAV